MSDLSKYQRPINLFIPDLETHPVWDINKFEWSESIINSFDLIKNELRDLLDSKSGFQIIYPKTNEDKLQTDTGAWAISWFHIYGLRNQEIISKCPITSVLLDTIPTANFAGLSLFSSMMPGTHLQAHCGLTNAKLRVNLPLIAENSRIRVADTFYTLKEGQLFIFDDSFEHEVFEDSSKPRFSLLFDIYHPGLSKDKISQISKKINLAHSRSYKSIFDSNLSHDTSWVYK